MKKYLKKINVIPSTRNNSNNISLDYRDSIKRKRENLYAIKNKNKPHPRKSEDIKLPMINSPK